MHGLPGPPQVFYDLMTPHLMDLLFGPAAWAKTQRLFRSLHISSEYPGGEGVRTGHKQVLLTGSGAAAWERAAALARWCPAGLGHHSSALLAAASCCRCRASRVALPSKGVGVGAGRLAGRLRKELV